MKTNITFIGLGVMGYHMAGHLSKQENLSVTVWNRTVLKSQNWQKEFSGKVANTIGESVANADIVISCVGRDEDMQEVLFSQDAAFSSLKENCLWIDHTTTSYNFTQEASKRLAQKKIRFIDAPVSGGEAGAIKGTLTAMCGGNEQDIEFASSVLKTYCQNITAIGKVGYGQLAKMANQICIGGVLQGLSEALLFAESENIDIEKLLSAISAGAAGSWQMSNRALTMHQRKFDFGFAIQWMQKDLGYCLQRAKENHSDLSFTETVYTQYQQLIKEGHGQKDTSVLILAKEKNKSP